MINKTLKNIWFKQTQTASHYGIKTNEALHSLGKLAAMVYIFSIPNRISTWYGN
jgi:hypothetical protein